MTRYDSEYTFLNVYPEVLVYAYRTITWKNGSETLDVRDVEADVVPVYDGDTPTKEGDQYTAYTFDKWSPKPAAFTGDATYEATFNSSTRTYTIKWKDIDGTVLETDENVPAGETPTYNGAAIVKLDGTYAACSMSGWFPSVTEALQDDTYSVW